MNVDYQNNNQELKIASDHGLILFRIVQECINNVIKHSRSKEMKLLVEDSPKIIKIMINDDGVGFNLETENDGSGLRSMASRAQLIGAKLSISSVENQGTKVTITYQK